jgi:ribosome-associated toxin RatA of RatAB toxin-antitoxin module
MIDPGRARLHGRPPRTGAGVALVGVALLALASGPGHAAEPHEIHVKRKGSTLRVHATLGADAPATTCYEVVADFDAIEEFIPDMITSDIVSAAGEPLLLRQVGNGNAGPFQVVIDVTLALTVQPPTRIDFERVAGNLERMRGRWIIGGDASRCEIDYRAEIEPSFWVPPLIGPRLMRNQLEKQMRGLLVEIRRRAKLHAPVSP